jgi:hypothetical protein
MDSSKLNTELPGMLELALRVKAQSWPHTVDAKIWTEKWMETIAENPNIPTDEGTMIGWFANAIMAGYDTAILHSKKSESNET